MTAPKQLAYRSALTASERWGQRTAGRRVLPTMLLAGAQRCGTTSLFKALLQHPCFLGPTLRKGVHYFDVNAHEPVSWYRAHFPTARAVERTSRKHGGAPVVVGESSPYYLWHPLAANRIASTLVDVRIVLLLRDPVERAYSAYVHERARGFETATFRDALARETERTQAAHEVVLQGHRSRAHQHFAYRGRGEYIDQVLAMEAAVGREQLLVIDSADFWATPEQGWHELTSFLGLTDAPVQLLRHNTRPRAPLDSPVRAELTEHFASFDARLAEWWGRTPSWRR